MKLKNKTILITSNEPWGDIWYSKHNWAFELSKNNEVYFINPPKRWSPKGTFNNKFIIEDYGKNLKILNYSNRLPYTRYDIPFYLNEKLVYKLINKFFKNSNEIIFWSFDPYRLINPQKLNLTEKIYFIADRYEIKREFKLINNVDFIISVSPELTKNIDEKRILNLSHGISGSEFTSDVPISNDYILYIGGIDNRLDFNLIEKLLIEFPNEEFLFIGKISKINDDAFNRIFIKKEYTNLIYKKAVHFKTLKNHIACAKICLAPMKLDVQGNSINHHKLLQYLALGKPILSAKFSDYQENNLLIEYEDMDNSVELLNIFLSFKKEDSVIIDKRISFARNFLYSNLINEIENFLD